MSKNNQAMNPDSKRCGVISAVAVWPAMLAGVTATLVGIGLARFAYTPLIPVLIEVGWFSASQAVYLGAANLLGYFVGALSAHRLSEQFPARGVVGISLAIVVLSFLLCAWPSGFYWAFAWRLLSGLAGAVLMVTVPSIALSRTPPAQRARVGTLSFAGIGIGAVLAAVVIPVLLTFDLRATWLVLGAMALVAAVGCDWGMRRMPLVDQPALENAEPMKKSKRLPIAVVLVMAAYALDAAGFIPHTVFWVDYLARQNEFGQAAASLQWAIFGFGALCGPFFARRLVARLGWGGSLALVFGMKALAIAMPVMSLALVSQTLSSFLVGALVPGLTALTSGRLAEIVGPSGHKKAWGQATAAFAAAQALSGYGMSAAYNALGTYTPLYGVASGLLLLGVVLVLVSNRRAVPS